jgi:addiction module HigA family antidote
MGKKTRNIGQEILQGIRDIKSGRVGRRYKVLRLGKLRPVGPGELLLEEFLKPMGLSRYRLAREIGVPPHRIGDIVADERAVTAEIDLRLCRFLGLSSGYWLRAQVAHDTEVAERALGAKLAKFRAPRSP